MRRSQLIQIAIIVVALICCYKAIESLASMLIILMYEFNTPGSIGTSFIIQYLTFTAIYIAVFFLSVKFNRNIAAYIDKGQATTTEDPEKVNVVIEQRNLLFIVVVAICLVGLIQEIPVLILSIYKSFKSEAGGRAPGSAADINFKNAAVKFVFTLIILWCARPISGWFSQQLVIEKPVIETPNES